MNSEPKITISIELRSGVGFTLTLAEAKALRAQLNELLGKDDLIAQPITLPFTSPVSGVVPLTFGEPLWRNT